jgi:SSS family solute:Na+ symporter
VRCEKKLRRGVVLQLTSVDWLILLLYLFFTAGIGFALKDSMKTGVEFLEAGRGLPARGLPAWICALAFVGAGVGGQEVIAMGAWGAKYGVAAAHFYWIGAVPAMVFAGVFMMPLYYGTQKNGLRARTVAEYVGMRFDAKTRALNACLFAATAAASAGVSLYALARLMQAMRIFDATFLTLHWPTKMIFTAAVVVTAVLVGLYVWLGGLTGTMYNQVLQFLVLVAGLLPVTLLGLKNIGGWAGMKAALPESSLHAWKGMLHAGSNAMGVDAAGLVLGLGFVVSAGFWCADFRTVQRAMAAESMEAARRTPLIAALPALLLPFLLVLPGVLAVGLPTPHTTETTRNEDGTIFHEIYVVAPQVEQGKGLVPAKVGADGKVLTGADGKPVIDYDMALPALLMHYLPAGMLGLGAAALIASFMSGIAVNISAFTAVFTVDLYQAHLRKDAGDKHYLNAGRWAAVGALLLAVGTAYAALRFGSIMDVLVVAFSVVTAPVFATLLAGMFWKRATGHGAFAGLAAGTAAALLHHGLTLPAGARRGIEGGWIAVAHHYPSAMAQGFYGAIAAFGVNLAVTVLVSLMTAPRPDEELAGLVYSLTEKPSGEGLPWWKRPERLAMAILAMCVALNLIFA